MTRTPKPPQGVWIEYPDGTLCVDLPVVYTGRKRGYHQWEVMAPRAGVPRAVGAAVLPARTTISIAFPHETAEATMYDAGRT